jgi:hypothetical protein
LLTSQRDSSNSESDIDGAALFDELRTLCNAIADKDNDSDSLLLHVLRRLLGSYLNQVLPSVSIALRIFLFLQHLLPVSFRFQSFIVNYDTDKTGMAQDQLVDVAVLSIENGVALCH